MGTERRSQRAALAAHAIAATTGDLYLKSFSILYLVSQESKQASKHLLHPYKEDLCST